jgi:hypothetical protein
VLKAAGICVGAIIVILALTWIAQGNNIFLYRVFGIQYANTAREIFEQSYSYNRSMAGDLVDLRRQYESTDDPNKRAAIETAARAKIAGYDLTQLHDPDLAAWARGLGR